MNEDEIDLIERFLSNKSTELETQWVLNRIGSDEAFAKAVVVIDSLIKLYKDPDLSSYLKSIVNFEISDNIERQKSFSKLDYMEQEINKSIQRGNRPEALLTTAPGLPFIRARFFPAEGWLSGQKHLTVNQAPSGYVGSNPAPYTILSKTI